MQNSEPDQIDGLLRLDQVLALVPISRSGWWAGVKEGRFPRPLKISPRVTVWKASDIQKFIKEVGAQ